MLSREEIIKYITKCVDCAMPILQDENGLDVSRCYSFMLDKDKKAKVNIVFENRIQIIALKHVLRRAFSMQKIRGDIMYRRIPPQHAYGVFF